MRDDEQTTSEDRATQLLTCETLSLAIGFQQEGFQWEGLSENAF